MLSKRPTFKLWLRLLLYGRGRSNQWLMMILALVIGLIAGYGAIGFYLAIDVILTVIYGSDEKNLATQAAQLPWWHIMAALIIGGLVVGQLLRFMTHHRTVGVPHVMESAALHAGHIPFRQGILSALTTLLSLGVGGSAGREGPVVHLGATLASGITRWLRLPPGLARTLLGCGVAAAVAASFNAPFAGVFFALEVVIGHYALHVLTPIVISAIAGTIISRIHLGDYPAFILPDYNITSYMEFPAFFLLGLVCSLVAIAFMASLTIADKIQKRQFKRYPYWLKPATGGFFVALIAISYPEVLSVGYEATSKALQGQYDLLFLLALIGAKILATVITIASRFGGGIFSPSLLIGALVGGAFGLVASQLFPDLSSSPGVYAIVGMGAMASAVLGAPISTMLIVFEITGDYSITIAVMIASSVASMFTTNIFRRSFFHIQLANRGVHLEDGRASFLLKSAKVRDHVNRDFFTVNKTDSTAHARALLLDQEGGKLIVTDDSGAMAGVITFGCLGDDSTLDAHQMVEEICDPNHAVIFADDPLERALRRFSISGESHIVVLESKSQPVVLGLLSHSDVMKEYNKALLESYGQDK